MLEQIAATLLVKYDSIRTEKIYVYRIKRYILQHRNCHPKDVGVAGVKAFLTHLAVARNVSASTRNQAKSALLYLYKEVLGTELPWLDNICQAKTLPRGAYPSRGAGVA